jgi:hypothetical protein
MGGLAGHMSHLYDNPRLTFTKIKSILQDAAEGALEGTEKTDGQNLYISFSVSDQELEFAEGNARAARNKSNIKSGGMSIGQLADKFSFNKSLKKSFSQALKDFENVIKSFPRAKQEEIFGPDTNIYYNAEIINPDTANVINYDSKLVSIHRAGGAEFDKETGSAVEVEIVDPETGELITGQKDVSRHAQTLADELDKIQQDLAGNKFKIEMDAVFNLKALENKEALNSALDAIEGEISAEGISDSQMVIEYIMARILSMIRERGMDLSEETESMLLKRVLLSNPSYRAAYGYDRMPRELDPRKIVKGASARDKNNAIYIIKNADQILKTAIEPIESAIHDFSVEMLKGLESLFILDNKKETERLRKEVTKAIKAIRGSGHDQALEILQKQMSKLKSVENISTAAEGFVFDHDGWTYKFTGNFAPINQILGLFKYGRSGIPPMEKLTEGVEEEAKRIVAIYPGRFQPMGKHHLEVFKKLEKEHGVGNVYILTSNSETNEKSPLTFKEKKRIMLKHGIPEDQIIEEKYMYKIDELGKYFDPDSVVAIYVVGNKDRDRLGKSKAFEKYENVEGDMKTFDNVAYLQIAPHISIKLPDSQEMSGTTIRKIMNNLDPEGFKAVMGWFDKDIYELLQSKFKKTQESLSQTIMSIIEEILQEKYEKKSCTKKTGKKGGCVVTTRRGKSCYDDCQTAYSAVELEERTGAEIPWGDDPPRKKKRKKGYKEPSLLNDPESTKAADPTFKDAMGSDDSEDMDLEEISGVGSVAGYSLPLGQKPKYFKDSKTKVKDPNVYNRKRKNK